MRVTGETVMTYITDQQYRDAIACTDELEVDPDATVSQGSDPGAWVQCWVWVNDSDLKLLSGQFLCESCGYAHSRELADGEPELCADCAADEAEEE